MLAFSQKLFKKVAKRELGFPPETSLFSSFFDFGTQSDPRYPKWSPKGAQRSQKSAKMQLKVLKMKKQNMEPKVLPKWNPK